MEEGKVNNNSINEENPSNNDTAVVNADTNNDSANDGRGGAAGRRRPFTDLSQVDADLVLARTLQEQVLYILNVLGRNFVHVIRYIYVLFMEMLFECGEVVN